MFRKLAFAGLFLLMVAPVGMADSIRPLYTKENALPELRHAEVGFRFGFVEVKDNHEIFAPNDTNVFSYIPSVRYRATEALTMFAKIPFVDIDSDDGSGDSGLGDVSAGLELLAWQDIFDYPWVMPHLEVVFDTADDGLGQGETGVILGAAVGSKTWEQVHWIGDIRYEVFQDRDNVVSVAGSIIWDISEEFGVLGEVKVSDEADDNNERPAIFLGGFSYKPNEDVTFTARGGGSKNTREDVIVAVDLTYDL